MEPATHLKPALVGRNNPCLYCPPITAKLPLDAVIAVGFGDAHASRDGEVVYREPSARHGLKRCDVCSGQGRIGKPSVPCPRILKRRSKKNDAERKAWAEAWNALPLCGTCGGEGDVEDPDAPEAMYWDVEEVEKLAARDPDHDWQIVLLGPLHGEVYQRHGVGEWCLIEKNEGFA